MRFFKDWVITATAGIVGGFVGMLIPIAIGICCGAFSFLNPVGLFLGVASLFGGCFGAMRGGTIAGRWMDRYR